MPDLNYIYLVYNNYQSSQNVLHLRQNNQTSLWQFWLLVVGPNH